MKKIYLSIACAITLSLGMNAQTIYDSGFDEASYDDAAVQTNLDAHPDWNAGHFANASTWSANTNNQIITGANFAYSILDTTPITAVVGDVVTITTLVPLGFGGATPQIFDNVNGDRAMLLLGLSPFSNPTMGPQLGQQRDGVIIRTIAASEEIQLGDASGQNNLTPTPTIAQAINNPYEIIIEFTIGTDAASSSKNIQIRNTTTDETSSVGAVTGMRTQVYDALVGPGAFYFNWAQSFTAGPAVRPAGAINTITLNRVTITKNNATLAVSDFNKEDISSAIYPNPASSELNINVDTETYKIISLSGATVLEVAATGTLNISGLTSGIYFLVTDAGTTRFVKQ